MNIVSRRLAALLGLLFVGSGPLLAQSGVWRAEGPGPQTEGQVENITDREVVGAVHAVAPHPTNPDVIYIGSVNGGVWRTGDAQATSPTWVPQTDQQTSLSIGAVEFDPTDATNQTLVAGIGGFSNIGGRGALSGVLRTTDGGATWVPIGAVALAGRNISGVAARGNIIVVADTNSGIWRSTDTGLNWTLISGVAGSGLPPGSSFDLEGVPGNQARLFTNAGSNGLFVSTDTGATWTRVSNAVMNALAPSNVRISATAGNVVYAAFASFGGTLAGIFRSGDGGTTWTAMDIPTTTEAGGVVFGIHPGGQAGTNMSLAADPTNGNIVYIGGDRQPGPFDGIAWPNSIGAQSFTGRLFRGDAGAAAGTQFVHLTHSNSQGPAGGGTANNSAPHANSRNMAFDAAGNLIEVDDGGIYRRTVPQTNAGLWTSLNGNLQSTEFHSVAWDAVSNRIIGGTQDVGTPEQEEFGDPEWVAATRADGGVVAVDDISTPGLSTRFFSSQNLGQNGNPPQINFRSRQYDSQNVLVAETQVPLTVLGGGPAIQPQFFTPVVVNNADGNRLIIGAANSVYESLDGGQTVTAISGVAVNSSLQGEAIGYGAADNVDMLYVGSFNQVFVRTGAHPASLLTASAAYPGGFVTDVAIDPNDSRTAYVIDQANVFQTKDGGASWANITGDLNTFNPGQFRSVDVFSIADQAAVVVGTDRGVYWAEALPALEWSVTCTGLPNAPVVDLEFDEADEILLAGTLGRGAWTCAPAHPRPTHYEVKYVCGTGDDKILGFGKYRTAINIINRDDAKAAPSSYRRSFSVALPGETAGGQTISRRGATLAPGDAAEIDCDDIVREVRRRCDTGLCKGFVTIDSPMALDIVAVYTAADSATGLVRDMLTEPVTPRAPKCTTTTLSVPEQTRLFVPPNNRGDREFGGHGPCVRFAIDLGIEDEGTALTANYEMHAFECAGSFSLPQHDFTASLGGRKELLASAGPNGRILGYSTASSLQQTYIDNNHADDIFSFSGDEPVSSLRFIGDTSGDESGTETGVFVTFRAMDVRLETCSVPTNVR